MQSLHNINLEFQKIRRIAPIIAPPKCSAHQKMRKIGILCKQYVRAYLNCSLIQA